MAGSPARDDAGGLGNGGTGRTSKGATAQLHRLGPLVVLLLGVTAMVGAYRLGLGSTSRPAPGLWPFVVAMLVAVTGTLLLFLDDPDDYETWSAKTYRIVAGLAGLGVFIVAFQWLGFVIAAFLMLTLWLRFFGEESWRWALSLGVGGSVAMHLLFVVAFGVPLPEGVLVPAVRG